MSNITIPEEQQPRAVRGLLVVFALTFLSLVGVMLTVTAFGGAGDWTRWQFIGLFAVLECASGAANIVLPNVWRLPVAETQTRSQTRLAPSVLLIPHWAAAARVVAGVVLVAATAVVEGVGPATLALVPFVVLLAAVITAASMLVARAGVARPDLDVVQFVIVRPRTRSKLPPVSIGASLLQFLLSITTIPIVKALPPSVLYQPEIGPSWSAMAVMVVLTAVSGAAVVWAWQGRIEWRAPADQQREAERYA